MNALVLGVIDFLDAGGHLLLGAAIVDTRTLTSEAQRAADCIHGGVAAADNDHVAVPARIQRLVELGEAVRPHEVHPSEKFVG